MPSGWKALASVLKKQTKPKLTFQSLPSLWTSIKKRVRCKKYCKEGRFFCSYFLLMTRATMSFWRGIKVSKWFFFSIEGRIKSVCWTQAAWEHAWCCHKDCENFVVCQMKVLSLQLPERAASSPAVPVRGQRTQLQEWNWIPIFWCS